MARDTTHGSAPVEEEAARLKAALRERMPALAADPGPDGGERTGPEEAHAGCAEPACPLCRVNRLAHEVAGALAPDLLEQVGRGLGTLGRTLTDCADALRRHRPDPSEATDDARPSAGRADPHPHEEPA